MIFASNNEPKNQSESQIMSTVQYDEAISSMNSSTFNDDGPVEGIKPIRNAHDIYNSIHSFAFRSCIPDINSYAVPVFSANELIELMNSNIIWTFYEVKRITLSAYSLSWGK